MRRHFWKRHSRVGQFSHREGCPNRMDRYRTLFEVPDGETVSLLAYLPEMPAERRIQLQAYGLLPGCQFRLLQHRPVVIIQIAQTELALEWDLARAITVTL